MDNSKRILLITRTAILIALLVVLQAITAPLGTPLITGSLVNMMLVISVMASGLPSGIAVALLSPVMAKLVGIGPFWSLIPFIAAGNITIVLLWYFIARRLLKNKYAGYLAALAIGAVGKFLVLYAGIVKFAVPILLQLPEKQAAAISATFSVSQLFTALIGGVLAVMILPVVEKALASRGK